MNAPSSQPPRKQTDASSDEARPDPESGAETGTEAGPAPAQEDAPAPEGGTQPRSDDATFEEGEVAGEASGTDPGQEATGSFDADVLTTLEAGLTPAQIARRKARSEAREQALKARAQRETLPVPVPQQNTDLDAPAERAQAPEEPPVVVPPPVAPARVRGRHWMALLTFMLIVVAPACLSGWYLWTRAADQYASFVGFSVRTEEKAPAIELLGNVTDLSGSSSSDTDILYEFLQSQELVAMIDGELDLRTIWSRADPQVDPVFAYHPPGTIEDLVGHWPRKVKIYYDSGTGLIDLRVLAFDPGEATAIAERIYAHASTRINELSAVAREDAISYAREELDHAEIRLKEARVAIQAFRNRTQIIDPTIQTQTQSGLIGALETQLAEAQIELGLLKETARPGDPRIRQTELKIEVIQKQIADERNELGLVGDANAGDASVADLVGAYEELAVDLEFAQQAYTAARTTYDAAQNEARRQSRYLAAHVTPTRAERAQYPERVMILSLLTLFLFLAWALVVLVAYALRDRR